MHEIPHELPNELENQKIPGKSQNAIELQPSAQSSPQNEKFFNTSKKRLKNRN